MSVIFTPFLFLLLLLFVGTSTLAQHSNLLGPRKGLTYEISEYSDTAADVDTSKAEILFWRIETNNDEKYANAYHDSIYSEKFNRELAVVLSCKELRELHLMIIDEVIHFPDQIRKIRELDSLIVLTIWYDDDVVVRTFGSESILTDEIEEFSYRPMDLSILRGMSNLEVFATNWNAEVHDPDALLDLHKLRYAQVPVASLQPDFFKNPHLEYVQCGLCLKLAWHKKPKKLMPWYEGEELIELFLNDTLALRQMEESISKRKKPIDWGKAFVHTNSLGDTVFHLQGTGKNYSIFYQDNEYTDSNSGPNFHMERNNDSIIARVDLYRECYRTSITTSDGKYTSMRLTYYRDYSSKEFTYNYTFKDHFINGKRSGNYDFIANDRLYTRRTYRNDSLIDTFPNDYMHICRPFFKRLKEAKVKVNLSFLGAYTRNDSIIRMTWGDFGKGANHSDYSLSVSLKDTILHGTTYAVDVTSDTVLVMHFENGIQQGRMYEKSQKDKKWIDEEKYFKDGVCIYGTQNDGTYFIEYDFRKEVSQSYRKTHIANQVIVQDTTRDPNLNESVHRWYDEKTGEILKSRIYRSQN